MMPAAATRPGYKLGVRAKRPAGCYLRTRQLINFAGPLARVYGGDARPPFIEARRLTLWRESSS